MSMLRSPARCWIGLVMALSALAVPGVSRGQTDATSQQPAPNEAAYRSLGRLVLMHEGRRKPLDTVARQEVKAITGRQSFEPMGPDGVAGPEWGPVAALFSWSNAPDYWDDQRFILAEYLPLRRMILSGSITSLLRAIVDDPETSDALSKRAQALLDRQAQAGGPEGVASVDELKSIARDPGLPDRLQDQVEALTHRIDGSEKFLSPRELEEATVPIQGRQVRFDQWYVDIAMRSRPDPKTNIPPTLSTLEKKVGEVFNRLTRYQSIRGDHGAGMMGTEVNVDRAIPRPANEQFVAFLGQVREKYDTFVEENKDRLNLPMIDRVKRDTRDVKLIMLETPGGQEYRLEQFIAVLVDVPGAEFNDVERDALATLAEYYGDLPVSDRKVPGADSEADRELMAWLSSDADWTPIALILDADIEELAEAGYDRDELATFREALVTAREVEAREPGSLDVDQANTLVASARALAADLSVYPTAVEVDREVHYNTFAPFYKAPTYYGLGFALLGLCLMIGTISGRTTGTIRNALYALGLLGLIGGIGLEVYGFALRILISGWAPVTNLYETVIWVALIAAVIGLILEAVYRRVYPAAAAAGVAMLCTIIAANAQSVLNPNIEALNPILRSNYWLTIHVITIVSSYAAFALALGLGLIGTWFYLTAPYRRDVGMAELSRPLAAVPVLAGLGALGIYGSYNGWASASAPMVSLWGIGVSGADILFFGGWTLAAGGIAVLVMVISGLLGELIARLTLRNQAAAAGEGAPVATSEANVEAASEASAETGGGTATLARPSIAAIKARNAEMLASGGGGDPREEAMRDRAEQVKPIASFVYRALQVGVLLVAAGTILGGVWADYSWGRFWGWDPKEVSALITLLVYLIPLHGRFAGWINSFGMTMAAVLCFNSVLMAWYGVNFLLGVGLHSYGFAEGGNQGAVLLSALLVSSLAFGAIWRRSLARRPGSPSPTAAA